MITIEVSDTMYDMTMTKHLMISVLKFSDHVTKETPGT